jgi:hypothetical protein
MPRGGATIFSDLIGKLDVLRVHCEKCGRAGRYWLQRLIDERGADRSIGSASSPLTVGGSRPHRPLQRALRKLSVPSVGLQPGNEEVASKALRQPELLIAAGQQR